MFLLLCSAEVEILIQQNWWSLNFCISHQHPCDINATYLSMGHTLSGKILYDHEWANHLISMGFSFSCKVEVTHEMCLVILFGDQLGHTWGFGWLGLRVHAVSFGQIVTGWESFSWAGVNLDKKSPGHKGHSRCCRTLSQEKELSNTGKGERQVWVCPDCRSEQRSSLSYVCTAGPELDRDFITHFRLFSHIETLAKNTGVSKRRFAVVGNIPLS